MKKNDLIKMLQEIKGNPDIMLWNGYVRDFVPIGKISSHKMYKYKRADYVERVSFEMKDGRKDWNYQPTVEELAQTNDDYNKIRYEYMTYVDEETHKSKTVAVIEARLVGKTYVDRLGNVEY